MADEKALREQYGIKKWKGLVLEKVEPGTEIRDDEDPEGVIHIVTDQNSVISKNVVYVTPLIWDQIMEHTIEQLRVEV